MVGVRGGFPGLLDGDVTTLGWGDVEGWVRESAASHLGTRRTIPGEEDLVGPAALDRRPSARTPSSSIGGFNAYRALELLHAERERYPSLALPIVVGAAPRSTTTCPGLQMAIGADTALNVAVEAVDRIKRSATSDPTRVRGRDDGAHLRLPRAGQPGWRRGPSASTCTRTASPRAVGRRHRRA